MADGPVEIAAVALCELAHMDGGCDACQDTTRRLLAALHEDGWRLVLPAADDPHYVVFKADGWEIEHSAGCRNSGLMLECQLHQDLTEQCDGPPAQGLGRFRAEPLARGWHLRPADDEARATALLYVEEWTP